MPVSEAYSNSNRQVNTVIGMLTQNPVSCKNTSFVIVRYGGLPDSSANGLASLLKLILFVTDSNSSPSLLSDCCIIVR